MNKILSANTGTVVLNEFTDGVNVVQSGTPLKFVNYFDGMLMRAETMKLEQQGMFNLSQLSNQASGHGVIWGFDSALSGAGLEVGSGMAINTDGRVVYLPDGIKLSIDELINKSNEPSSSESKAVSKGFAECEIKEPSDSVTVIGGTQYYVITVDSLQALCGEEDVYGRLCEEACTTSTDRPHQLNGVVIRAEALPSNLVLPQSNTVSLSGTHLRSRIASAFYEYERNSIASHISGEGLAQSIWCNGAKLPGSFTRGVPIALLARQGSENLFLDRWIVTRERMESPPRNYWAHVMAMRPWNQFLAQVLQFQCQINNLFGEGGIPVNPDPCADTKAEVKSLTAELEKLLNRYQIQPNENEGVPSERRMRLTEDLRANEDQVLISKVAAIQSQLAEKAETAETNTIDKSRALISGGIVETPPAGYLPITVDSNIPVNEQVKKLLGEGVELRFCTVRPDYIPHALEEAQHMERISLLEGLDDPSKKPRIDVLVPNGTYGVKPQGADSVGYDMELKIFNSILPLAEVLLETPQQKIAKSDTLAERNDRKSNATELREYADELLKPASAASENNVVGTQNYREPQKFVTLRGVGRGINVSNTGVSFAFAGIGQLTDKSKKGRVDRLMGVEAIREVDSAQEAQLASLWTAMEIADNPFSMQVGSSTSAKAEIDLVVQERITGRLKIDADIDIKLNAKNGGQIELRLVGDIIIRRNDSNEEKQRTISLNQTATVQKRTIESGAVTLARIVLNAALSNMQSLQLSAIRNWPSDDLATFSLATSTSHYSHAERGRELVNASQKVNGNVLNPTHPRYEDSYAALNFISSTVKQPTLTEIRARRLFGDTNPDAQSQQVMANHDWVFFHRRRDKQCASAVIEPVLSDRPYRVFVANASGLEHANRLYELIRSQNFDALNHVELKEVSDISYDSGSANLKTSPQRVLSDWNLIVNSDVKIHSGLVASDPDWNEPPALVTARVDQLNQIIDDKTQFIDDARFQVLSELPNSVSQLERGIIIYITLPVSTTCQTVFRLPRNSDIDLVTSEFDTRLKRSKSIEELVKDLEAQLIGELRFVEQSAEVFDEREFNELNAIWNEKGNGPISAVISLSEGEQAADAVHTQAKGLGESLKRNAEDIHNIQRSASLSLGDCWGVTFILPSVISRVAVARFNGLVPETMMPSLEEALTMRGSREVMSNNLVSAGTIKFNSNAEVINVSSLARVKKRLVDDIPLSENIEWRVLSIYPKGASAETRALIEKESKVIAESISDDTLVSLIADTEEELLDGANSLTLMVPVDKAKKLNVLPVSIAGSPSPDAVFHFDENDELIKDEHFDEQIKQLKLNGVTAAAAEMVGKTKPRSNDKRLNEVFEALKDNEILNTDAAKKTLKLETEELSALDVGSFRMTEALVLRRQ